MEIINFIKYSDDFKWDYTLHFPVPTINYITKRTGHDLAADYDTILEAEGAVVAATRSAKNYLFSGRTDMLAWEYNLARNKKMIYDVLEFICEFINFALITGDYDEYFKANHNKLESIGLASAKQNLLGPKQVLIYSKNIREGYWWEQTY